MPTTASSVRSGSTGTGTSAKKAASTSVWRATTKMNVRDLSNDDDFLSHLLIEKLGPGGVPLQVHRMDFKRRLPKTSTEQLVAIIHRFVTAKGPSHVVIRAAVDELLRLQGVRAYLKNYTPHQINAFATHASRYFELYIPTGCIEITHTSRYTHKTGKSELCILATRSLPIGAIVTELKGSMADLSDDEERRLQSGDARGGVVDVNMPGSGLGVRRDFSVIHSKQKKMNHLFLGPARFVNHDCENNVELFRDGRYITFRVIRPITLGDEITTHYGDAYFGKGNKDCLCATCERKGRGGYAPQYVEGDEADRDDPVARYMAESSDDEDGVASGREDSAQVEVNVHERRTRRGVYHVEPERSLEREDDEDDTVAASNDPVDFVPSATSSLTSLATTLSTLTTLPDDDFTDEAHATAYASTPTPEVVADAGIPTPPCSESTPIASRSDSEAEGEEGASRGRTRTRESLPARQEPSPPAPKRRPRRSEAALLSLDTPGAMSVVPDVDDEDGEERRRRRRALPVKSYDLIKRRAPRKKRQVSTQPAEEDVEPSSWRGTSARTQEDEDQEEEEEEEEEEAETPSPPLCRTCRKILPIIHSEGQIVYGDFENGDEDHDCPRCLRHLFIYRTIWPWRVLRPGTSVLPTPREDSPAETAPSHKTTHPIPLPVLDRKIASVAQNRGREKSTEKRKPYKRSLSREASAERPTKHARRAAVVTVKQEPTPAAESARLLSTPSSVRTTRSGRPAFPSAKVRAVEPEPVVEEPVKRKPGRPRKHPLLPPPPPEEEEPVKRKPGRPRKRPHTPSSSPSPSREPSPTPHKRGRTLVRSASPTESSPASLKKGYSSKSAAVKRQPREGSGRFGKKEETNGIHSRKKHLTRQDREQRSAARARAREVREREERERMKADLKGSGEEWETDEEGDKEEAKEGVQVSTGLFQDGEPRREEKQDDVLPPAKRMRTESEEVEDIVKEEEEEVIAPVFPNANVSKEESYSALSPDLTPQPTFEVIEPERFVPFKHKPLGGLLFRAPNPSRYRHRAWVTRDVPSNDEEKSQSLDSELTADENEPPVTSDDFFSGRGLSVESKMEVTGNAVRSDSTSHIIHKSVKLSPASGELNVSVQVKQVVSARSRSAAWKPNPFNLSRRRFVSTEEETLSDPLDRGVDDGESARQGLITPPTPSAVPPAKPILLSPYTTQPSSTSVASPFPASFSSLHVANAFSAPRSPTHLVVAGWDDFSDSDE